MEDCIFCQICQEKIPAKVFYEDKDILVFHDIKPQAPVHLLIIPKKHLVSLNEAEKEEKLIARLIITAKKMAEKAGISVSGYRLIVNSGPDSGQEVDHLHLHLLGGRKL